MSSETERLQTVLSLLLEGHDLARDALRSSGGLSSEEFSASGIQIAKTVPQAETPVWKPKRRVLLFEGQLVKKYRQPAPSQEIILAAFQEEGWPPHILDPLPPRPDSVPSERLRTTIRNLNARQKNPLIRFESDGHGEGICWFPRHAM